MKKSDLKILERIFAAEIDGRLPYQSRSKHLHRLHEEGYVQIIQTRLGGRFPVIIRGWALTEFGRMTYCMSCKDDPKTK